VSGNVGVTRNLVKEIAKAQGGWESDSQDRYHRVHVDQVVQIPTAIVASFTERATAYDFCGINGPVDDPLSPRAARSLGTARFEPTLPPVPDPPGERTMDPPGQARADRVARLAAAPTRVATSSMAQHAKLPKGWMVGSKDTKRTSRKFYISPDGIFYASFKSAVSAAGFIEGTLEPQQQQPSVPPPLTMRAQRAAAPIARQPTAPPSLAVRAQREVTPTMREVNAAKPSSSVNSGREPSTVSERLSRRLVAPAPFDARG
jgi:hypothetical protein